MGEGDISTVGNIVDLKIMGRDASFEFNPPEDCVVACRVHASLFTDNTGIDLTCETVWTFLVQNVAGTVTTTTSPVTGTSSGSSTLANIDLSLVVASSLVEVGLEVQTNGTSANTLYASARLDYVWARLR